MWSLTNYKFYMYIYIFNSHVLTHVVQINILFCEFWTKWYGESFFL